MNHVERFRAVMGFRPFDRLPRIEWAPWWDKTVERWRGEGLPEHLRDAADIRDFFGLDPYRQLWIRPYREECPQPAGHGLGIVEDEKGYEEIHNCLYPEPAFNMETVRQWREAHREGDMVVWISLDGFFWHPRNILGIERHLLAFYDQRELMHRINRDLLEFNLRAVDEFCRSVCAPDFMTFAEDMSYNHGPMLSKRCYDDFIAPYYRRIVPALKEKGIIPIVDSDGDITSMIPWLEEAGIEGALPCERRAGVDICAMRRKHPGFKVIGAFDKTVMKDGEAAMRREFERLLPAAKTGGFIPSVDHQTPPEVSLETYRTYVKLLGEYCGRAGVKILS